MMIQTIKNIFFKRKIWFTSDLHFGHRNVIQYCNRPFIDIQTMTEGLIKIWNDTVNKGDLVYVLGDFSLNPKWSKEILPRLNGDKILIPGNHDACFKLPSKEDNPSAIKGRNEKYKRMCDKYLKDGWKEIHQSLTIQLKNGRSVLLSHLPYSPKEGEDFDKRYITLRPKDEGLFLLHGHLHCKYRKYNNMIDVGIDGDLKLWSEDEIISLINDERNFIPSPITEYYKNRKDEKRNMKGEDI